MLLRSARPAAEGLNTGRLHKGIRRGAAYANSLLEEFPVIGHFNIVLRGRLYKWRAAGWRNGDILR